MRWLAIVCTLPLAAAAGRAPAQDVDAEIAAARRVPEPVLPAAKDLKRPVGRVNGEPITLGELLEEVIFLYAEPLVEVVAREKALLLEAERRGVEVTAADVRREVERFLAAGRGRGSLAARLRARGLGWQGFRRRMEWNARVAAMLRADTGRDLADPQADAAGRRWLRGILRRYEIVTDPLRLPPGVYAVIRVKGGEAEVRVRAREIWSRRLPRLKLVHLDEALARRARWKAFLQALAARKLSWSEERVRRRVATLRREYRVKPLPWEHALRVAGRNVYLELRRLRMADAVDQIIGRDASPAVLRAYYEAHIDHFGRAMVLASHILVSRRDPETGRIDDAAARKVIEEVYRKLQGGARFVDLVAAYSEDPVSRSRGGDIGMFPRRGPYDPEFTRAAFALREGEISPPVRTRQGWHIIYCRKKFPPDRKRYPFEKVRDQVAADRQEDLRERWLEKHVYRPLRLESRLDEVWRAVLRRRRS